MAVLIKKNCDQQTLKVSRDLKKRKRNGERNNFKFHIGRLRGKYKQWRNGRDEQMGILRIKCIASVSEASTRFCKENELVG